MEKYHSPKLPSLARACIRHAREHYFEHLINELKECQEEADFHNQDIGNPNEHWKILTETVCGSEAGYKGAFDLLVADDAVFEKSYRQDMIILKGENKKEVNLCWPVLHDIIRDIYIDDYPHFNKQNFIINSTTVELNAFPWYDCHIELFPDAYAVLGIVELWFQKWYHPKKPATPFNGVIHRLEFSDNIANNHVMTIDLGSAPAAALIELIEIISRRQIKKIRIL